MLGTEGDLMIRLPAVTLASGWNGMDPVPAACVAVDSRLYRNRFGCASRRPGGLREGRRLPSLGNLHRRSSRPFTPAFSGSVLLGDLDDLPEFLEKVLIQSER